MKRDPKQGCPQFHETVHGEENIFSERGKCDDTNLTLSLAINLGRHLMYFAQCEVKNIARIIAGIAGFHWAFVQRVHSLALVRGAAGCPLRGETGAAPTRAQSVPVGSNGPPQGMAEPSSQDGSASGRKYLRKGKNARQRERREKVRNSSVNTKVRRKRGGGTPGTERDHTREIIYTAVHRGDIQPAVYGGLHTITGMCALKQAAAHGGPVLEHIYSEECSLREGLTLEKGKKNEEEGAAQRTCYGPTVTPPFFPIPHFLCTTCGGRR